jgi:hypothetical protein
MLACVLGTGVATPAIAYHVVFDAGLAGTTSANYVSIVRCGMIVNFPSSAGAFLLAGGLGVGASGTTIENGEEVVVTLPAASFVPFRQRHEQ